MSKGGSPTIKTMWPSLDHLFGLAYVFGGYAFDLCADCLDLTELLAEAVMHGAGVGAVQHEAHVFPVAKQLHEIHRFHRTCPQTLRMGSARSSFKLRLHAAFQLRIIIRLYFSLAIRKLLWMNIERGPSESAVRVLCRAVYSTEYGP